MKLGKALIVAAAGAGLLAFAAPADAQMHGRRGGVSVAAWHGHPGWGWHGRPWWGWRGRPGWGWRGNVAFGFYGYPYWGWGYPYGYPYGYYAYPPPRYYAGGHEKIYDGHVAHGRTDAKDFSAPNE